MSDWQPDAEWQAHIDELAARGDVKWGGEPPRAFSKGILRALVGREMLIGDDQPRWHISVSTAERVPTWQELADAAHELRPGVPMAAGVPPRSWWVNIHPNVLHLWEIRDTPLIDQWRAERRGDRPS